MLLNRLARSQASGPDGDRPRPFDRQRQLLRDVDVGHPPALHQRAGPSPHLSRCEGRPAKREGGEGRQRHRH